MLVGVLFTCVFTAKFVGHQFDCGLMVRVVAS